MKIIGKAKGKKSNTWCLIRDSRSGIIYEDYVGNWPLHGSEDAIRSAVAVYQAKRGPEPAVLPVVPHLTFHKWEIEHRGGKLTEEQQKLYDARTAYDASKYQHRLWSENETCAHLEPVECNTVFEAELRFIGYTRGRSSVTMKFQAENGQEIQFGPSGINDLIQSMIDGKTPTIALTGTYEVEEDWDSNAQVYKTIKHLPRGQGIKATFKFTKKGQNVYAELVEEWV